MQNLDQSHLNVHANRYQTYNLSFLKTKETNIQIKHHYLPTD